MDKVISMTHFTTVLFIFFSFSLPSPLFFVVIVIIIIIVTLLHHPLKLTWQLCLHACVNRTTWKKSSPNRRRPWLPSWRHGASVGSRPRWPSWRRRLSWTRTTSWRMSWGDGSRRKACLAPWIDPHLGAEVRVTVHLHRSWLGESGAFWQSWETGHSLESWEIWDIVESWTVWKIGKQETVCEGGKSMTVWKAGKFVILEWCSEKLDSLWPFWKAGNICHSLENGKSDILENWHFRVTFWKVGNTVNWSQLLFPDEEEWVDDVEDVCAFACMLLKAGKSNFLLIIKAVTF